MCVGLTAVGLLFPCSEVPTLLLAMHGLNWFLPRMIGRLSMGLMFNLCNGGVSVVL